jgi:hypothetical protein
MVEHGAAALLGVHVARSLYGRWRGLGGRDRARLERLAEDVKRRALDLRGSADRPAADDELRSANEALAAGIVELAEADPEVSEAEVRDLRDDLARELERLTSADIKASRITARDTSPSDVEPRDGEKP